MLSGILRVEHPLDILHHEDSRGKLLNDPKVFGVEEVLGVGLELPGHHKLAAISALLARIQIDFFVRGEPT